MTLTLIYKSIIILNNDGEKYIHTYILPLSYGALHARENIIVDFELGVGLKLDNFHSFMNSAMQSSVAQG